MAALAGEDRLIRKHLNAHASALAALLMTTCPAAAQTARTEVITIDPPKDWVLSVWQGGTIELGEFTPENETGARYIDLLGYSALPRVATRFANLDDLRKFEREDAGKECRSSQYAERPAPEGWVSLARICIGRQGAAADAAELEFATTTFTDQGVYRIWRTHRASAAEIAASSGMPDLPANAVDETGFARIVEAWGPRLEPDLERRGICDLESLSGCETISNRLPDEAQRFLDGGNYVVGVWLSGEKRISRERFLEFFQAPDDATPSQVIAVLDVAEIDWSDAEAVSRLLTMIAYGQAADGALLAITDSRGQVSAADRATVRANVIQNIRRLARPGIPMPEVIIAIPRS